MKKSTAILRADREGPTSWPQAEIVEWPRTPRRGEFLEPRILVRRKVPDVAGPNGERLFHVPGAGTHVSLFTGAGGMDIGMEQAGFVTVVQHEWDESCCETLIHNRPRFFRHAALIQGDIRLTPTSGILAAAELELGEADVLTGGPPCQGFSTASGNRRRAEVEGDERNDLVFEYLRVVDEAKPKFFIFENVPGLLSFNKGDYLRAFLAAAYDCYYELVYGLVNCVDYGVPQNRVRFICTGTRRDLAEINGTLGALPAPVCFSNRDLKRIKLWTPDAARAEDLSLLLQPPGIRYFPDRPVLVPPRPSHNVCGNDRDVIDPETGERDGGRSKTFIEFYRRLRREEPDRIVETARPGRDGPPPRERSPPTVVAADALGTAVGENKENRHMSGGKSAAAGKSRTKKARGLEEPEGNGHAGGNGKAPPGPPAAELRAQLDKIHAQQAELSPHGWQDSEKKRRLDKQERELAPALEAAELRELPAAAPLGGGVVTNFQERPVPVAAIRLTGNHREPDATDDVELERLARLITAAGGLQQPIGVRDAGDGTFELIWGSRRLAAWKKLDADDQIPAKVYPRSLTPADVEFLRSIENLGKKDLSAVERALALARNIDAVKKTLEPIEQRRQSSGAVGQFDPEFARELRAGMDLEKAFGHDPALLAAAKLSREIEHAGGLHAYVAGVLGRDVRWVKDNAYVSELGGEARKLLAAGRVTVAHARELAKLKDPKRTDEIAERVARDENGLGGMSVADCRRMVVEAMCDLSRVPWDLHTAFGKDERKGCAGYACSACPHNSRNEPDLFDGVVAQNPERGVCTNPACFEVKEKIAARKLDEAVAAARKEKKEHKVELTVRGLGAVISKFRELKPESLVRRVKKVLEPQEKKPAASRSSMYGRQLSPAEKAEADARGKFQEAKRKWAAGLTDAVNKALAEKPGRFIAFELLKIGDVWSRLQPRGDAKKAARTADDGKTKKLVAHLRDPSIEGIAALEAEALKTRFNNLGADDFDLQDMVPEGAALLASTLGIATSPPPDVNTFLQEAKAKLADKPPGDHAAAAEHHKQLKAGKGKKKPTVLPPAGDDEDEDAELAGVGADDEED